MSAETHTESCGMATEQMAQMFAQPSTTHSAVGNHQQQMFQQSLEMQRPQSQVQMETLTNFGAAQVAKTTFDAQDFQTKAFAKMKGFTRVSRKLGRIGGTGSALKLRAVSVKRLRPWIGLRTDTINRFLSFPFSLFVFVHVSQFFHISSFLFFKRCLPIFVLE